MISSLHVWSGEKFGSVSLLEIARRSHSARTQPVTLMKQSLVCSAVSPDTIVRPPSCQSTPLFCAIRDNTDVTKRLREKLPNGLGIREYNEPVHTELRCVPSTTPCSTNSWRAKSKCRGRAPNRESRKGMQKTCATLRDISVLLVGVRTNPREKIY